HGDSYGELNHSRHGIDQGHAGNRPDDPSHLLEVIHNVDQEEAEEDVQNELPQHIMSHRDVVRIAEGMQRQKYESHEGQDDPAEDQAVARQAEVDEAEDRDASPDNLKNGDSPYAQRN